MAKRMKPVRRPRGVPPEARLEKKNWVMVALDDQGRRHGLEITWRADGARWMETTFVEGLRHGRFVEYHDSGAVAYDGNFAMGEEHGLIVRYRPDQRSRSHGFPAASQKVWRYEEDKRNGTRMTTRCFDRTGRHVTREGIPVPDPPPEGVPRGAWFEPGAWGSGGYWLLGDRDEIGRAHGVWTTWDFDSRRVSELTYDAGVMTSAVSAIDDANDDDDDDDRELVPAARRTLLFGEDGAGDWLTELDDKPRLSTIERALRLRVAGQRRGYLDVDDCHGAVAAAGSLAQLLDGKAGPLGPRVRATLSDELARRDAATRGGLRKDAIAAVRMVLEDSQRSELAQSYVEIAGAQARRWQSLMRALMARLDQATTSAPHKSNRKAAKQPPRKAAKKAPRKTAKKPGGGRR